MADHEGFTKSYRSKWENPVFRNLLEAAIWSWMCDAAAWKDTKVRFAGEVVELKRGQLITSRSFISKGFGIGEQVTRTFLENIEKDEMVNLQTTRKGTIITICNYEKYQSNEITTNQQTNQHPTSTQPAANHNKKEDKNLRTKELSIDNAPPEGVSDVSWKEFLALRKKKRATNTPHAIDLIFREIQKLKEQGFSPQDLIDQTLRRGWIDVYPIKEKNDAIARTITTATKTDRLRASALRAAEAGGYASSGRSSEAGYDNDAISVFPIP